MHVRFRLGDVRPQRHLAAVIIALLLAPLLLCALAEPVMSQDATVGIYSDTRGTSCSFSNPGAGLVTAHVVFRPDARGFRAVRFSAPMPACFHAVWIQDLPTERTHKIGDSQTGIAVAGSECEDAPVHILDIQYYQTQPASTCCEFPVLADPYVQMIEAIDCNQESFAATGSTAYLNANESCLCSANVPPLAPFNPTPADGAEAVSVYTELTWSAGDFDDNLASFDLYLGAGPDPPLHAAGLTQTSFQPDLPLSELTTFYWRVVARDEWDAETSSPVWSFTTRLTNSPPDVPHNPTPPDGSTGRGLGLALAWECGDIDTEPLFYDVYLGTSTAPPLYLANLRFPQYSQSPWDHDALTWNTVYYWRVVARDPAGNATSSPLWSFRTRPWNWPPNSPSSPSPPDASNGWPISAGQLTWSCSDRDPDDWLLYDVYFGATNPPPKVLTGRNIPDYAHPALSHGTQYFWRIVARDNHGAETPGPAWTFTTVANPVPVLISRFEAVARNDGIELSWMLQSDQAMESYSINRREGSSPPVVITSGAVDGPGGRYLDSFVTAGSTYEYELVVRTTDGGQFRSQARRVTVAPISLVLGTNHPNPFNPQTTIPYTVPASGAPVRVRLAIYDTSGRSVRVLVEEDQSGGAREVLWTGTDASGRTVSSGVYLCVLEVGKERRTQKLVLLK